MPAIMVQLTIETGILLYRTAKATYSTGEAAQEVKLKQSETQNTSKSTNAPGNKRKRHLNVIYFVDSSKTRSFKMTLGASYLVFGSMGVILIWSALSAIMLFATNDDAGQKSARIQSLLTSIYQYQIRYDKVYERAYPREGTKKETISALNKDTLGSFGSKNKKKQDSGYPNLSAKPNIDVPTKPTPRNENNYGFEIENLKTWTTQKGVLARFSIRNKFSPTKSTGHVWGRAEYVSNDGKVYHTSSPDGVNADSTGKPGDYKRTYNFAIKYYKSHTLVFKPPESVEGRFLKVRIFIGDKSGQIISQTAAISVDPSIRNIEGLEDDIKPVKPINKKKQLNFLERKSSLKPTLEENPEKDGTTTSNQSGSDSNIEVLPPS